MTVAISEITATLSRYLAANPDEREGLVMLLSCLEEEADVTSRAAPVHVTCGAAVINDRGQILMIHHNALARWLLPGGHLDADDSSLLAAAGRELAEETGIPWQQVASPPALDYAPLDIDLHQIPANPAKAEPQHWHADFRFAFRVKDAAVSLQLEEVSDYAWRPASLLQATRLAAKINCLVA